MKRNKLLPLTETMSYIMLALREPAHGYVIMQKVEEMSAGAVRIAAGTLYGAIENLMKHKLIGRVETQDARRKVYVLTDQGRDVLELDIERMQHIIHVYKGE
ncbi:PadR family transcriptional regulator [Thermoactinomyces sp. DSM 45892]|uniref:PadR family transcriptional regulator n=1 Tax=Thermoactinomyces sp. DSM 45892 TaxID=1882753 RepID=UPI00089A1A66|nr:helix-turn-helix transcriptional regulator [Thermoactinomyces sp. DSM 45892]SDY27337.1 transcriptional regulator, PadR family [Thermoactinomyces sp. DSM 45892]